MKKLLIFAGPPCSGKSTVGDALGWPHLEMDAARVRLLPGSQHTRPDRETAYRAILWTAEWLLRYTGIVICNGGFGHSEDRTACGAVCSAAQAELYLVEFQVPLPLALSRNRVRRPAHPGIDLSDERVTDLVKTYPWTGLGLSVHSSRSVDELVESVRTYVRDDAPVVPGAYR